jgi:hypothetical protein
MTGCRTGKSDLPVRRRARPPLFVCIQLRWLRLICLSSRYEFFTFSKPATLVALLSLPVVLVQQWRFAQDTCAALKAVLARSWWWRGRRSVSCVGLQARASVMWVVLDSVGVRGSW